MRNSADADADMYTSVARYTYTSKQHFSNKPHTILDSLLVWTGKEQVPDSAEYIWLCGGLS
jgi:hypothetical protein